MQELIKDKNKVFGLTGPIGCGKSKVSEYLQYKGAYIIDADLIAREVIKNSDVVRKLKNDFPANIFVNYVTANDFIINRTELAKLIFNNQKYKNKLDGIMHPKIYDEFIRLLSENKNKSKLIIYSAPLLLNSKYDYKFLNGIIVIKASKETCINRIIKRDKLSREEAINRLNAQMSIEEQIAMADFVIDNNENWENTIISINKFLNRINE